MPSRSTCRRCKTSRAPPSTRLPSGAPPATPTLNSEDPRVAASSKEMAGMDVAWAYKAFAEGYDGGDGKIVLERFVEDLEKPVLGYLEVKGADCGQWQCR